MIKIDESKMLYALQAKPSEDADWETCKCYVEQLYAQSMGWA